MSLSIAQFSKFFKTSYKHGSLIIAIIIPISFLMNVIDFISLDFMILINQTIIVIELSLAFFKLGLNEYLKARTLIAEVNQDLKAGNIEKAKKDITDNVKETIKVVKETSKEAVESIKNIKSEKELVNTSEPLYETPRVITTLP